MSRMVLIGCGLIGSSFALAARNAGLVAHVTGIDSSQQVLDQALDLGITDVSICSAGNTADYERALDEVLSNAGVVLVAVPVSSIAAIVIDLFQRSLPAHCLVFDVGSVKHKIVGQVRSALGFFPSAYVPLHPIAGSEQHGPRAASAQIFRQRKVVLSPQRETADWAVKRARELWEACGAQVSELDSARHDQILAAISHMPHLLSFGLMAWLDREHSDDVLDYAAGGLRDFSRIAESDAEMWASIFKDNAQNVLPQIDELVATLLDIRVLIEQKDNSGLRERLDAARHARLRLIDKIGKN